jgi:hypothetical protein
LVIEAKEQSQRNEIALAFSLDKIRKILRILEKEKKNAANAKRVQALFERKIHSERRLIHSYKFHCTFHRWIGYY